MDNDDVPIGRVLTRREALAVMGVTGLAFFTGCTSSGLATTDTTGVTTSGTGSGTCVVRPALTEGPYFVDEKLNRSDIRSDPSTGVVKPGALLQLNFNVSRYAANACAPLAGVIVDVWHCDHLGAYSDVADPGFNTSGQKFLRGYQTTDANGAVSFTTIYPGWYSGRTVHIHFKMRTGSYEFTSQFFFDDTLTDTVQSKAPYAAKGQRTTRNSNDGIYGQSGGQMLLPVVPSGQGYSGTFNIALQGV
jgi:protocatechuate 3,4-dioxygenase beta subunit